MSVIDPLTKDEFMRNMEKSENTTKSISKSAVSEFYDWMYEDQSGVVQTCAFPVPSEDQTKSEMGEGKWVHAREKEEYVTFCDTHSDLWRYHVYAGVNTLDESPRYGRGSVDHIDRVRRLAFDIELAKDSYKGSSKEDVWWTYQYALAEIKFISERYGAWPMVVMSENGIHLHYKVDFPCDDGVLYNKQHLYSKYITQQAMDNKYVEAIESKAPDHIQFDQDDVSDPARVMKVPGTKGIKSENGRMCGVIHKPELQQCGVVTMSDVDVSEDEIKDYLGEDNNSTSQSSSGDIKSIDTTPSDLNNDVAERIEHYVKVDEKFTQYWNGDVDEYDSRSEMEFAFVIKLLNHGFTEEEIVEVMWASGMSKWNEESDHYRKKTLENAQKWFDGSVTKDSTNGSFSFSEN